MTQRILMLWLAIAATRGLCADAPAAAEPENLAPNPSFEMPAGPENATPEKWNVFTTRVNGLGVTREIKRTGDQALKMTAQKFAGSFQGAIFEMPVAEGEKYSFSAFVMNSRSDPLGGSAVGTLVIEWRQADNREVSRAISSGWDSKCSRIRWELMSLNKVKVPAGATKAIFGIHLTDGAMGGTGSIIVDDVTISRN